MIWPIFGTAVHSVLESSIEQKNTIVEGGVYTHPVMTGLYQVRLIIKRSLRMGRIRVTDYKVTSVWSVIHGKKRMGVSTELLRLVTQAEWQGTLRGIRICAILRIGRSVKAATDSDYPSAPVVIIDLPLWTRDECQKYVEERMSLHQEAQINYDIHGELPFVFRGREWGAQQPTL